MNKECYLLSPAEVEVFPVKNGTDIIIRQDIEEVTKEQEVQTEDGESTVESYTAYECNEVQLRVSGSVTAEEVESNLTYYLELAESGDEVAANDAAATESGEPTVIERVEALEGAFLELVEVIVNG